MLTTVLMCQQGIPLQISPARYQMVEELKQRGSEVIIFFPGIVDNKMIRSNVKRIINTKRLNISSIRNKIRKINPDIVICFTIQDTEICFPLPHFMKGTDFYYFNLEIYVKSFKWRNGSLLNKIISRADYIQNKIKEIIYVRGCQAIVIQDALRKRVLKKYWISHPRTWLIPNSYYSNFYREDNIVHKNGLIYSGLLCEDVIGSFIKQVRDFRGIEITLSGWGSYKDVDLLNNPNMKIVKQNLSQEEYTKFIGAYDIALIWYSNKQDENIYNIGLSSGKFFKHLSIGQPVIVNNMPGIAEEVKKYKLGVVINDLSELVNAVQTIYNHFEFYKKNIRKVYKKKYDYQKASKQFFDSVICHAKESKS